jgi:chromosome segregation ATPase
MSIKTVETEVEVLKNVVGKLDTSIEKITDVSNQITKMLAVHERRLDELDNDGASLKQDIKEVHSRLTTVSREIVDEIKMLDRSIRSEATIQHKELAGKIDDLESRLGVVERWKFFVIGGAIVAGFLFGQIDLSKIF